MTLQSSYFLTIMLLSNALPSYGRRFLQESVSFQDDIPSLVRTNWQLKEINGAAVLLDDPPVLFFSSESSLEGSNGCQLFSAEWGIVPSSSMITVDIQGETRNLCPPMTDEQQQQGGDFMSLLSQDAIAYSISEDEQELTMYRDDTPTMILMRIPRPIEPHERLIDTSWIATDIRGLHATNTLRPVMEGNPITLSFTEVYVTGNAGCNQFSGIILSMTSTELQLGVDLLEISAKPCGQDAMSQEHTFMQIIQNPSLQYTLSYERVGEDEWTQVLALGSPHSTMARLVPFIENHDEEIEPSFVGSDEAHDESTGMGPRMMHSVPM